MPTQLRLISHAARVTLSSHITRPRAGGCEGRGQRWEFIKERFKKKERKHAFDQEKKRKKKKTR